jgi:uncharacterized protein
LAKSIYPLKEKMRRSLCKLSTPSLAVVTVFTLNAMINTPWCLSSASTLAPRFQALVIAETIVDGQPETHAPMVAEAKLWLNKLALDSNFSLTYIDSPNSITDSLLTKFSLIIQLNYTPNRWNLTSQAAFEKYIDQGKGGWVGLHHGALYGPVVTPASEKLWTWYYDFIGKINYKNYIKDFAAGTVRVEDTAHPVLKGIPKTFLITTEEWYIWDKSPRANVHVLANVDESSYKPTSTMTMGDHPVIWTNEKYKARNVYIFIGHHPNLYQNEIYKNIFSNAILWASSVKPVVAIRAQAEVKNYERIVPPDLIDIGNGKGYHADGKCLAYPLTEETR